MIPSTALRFYLDPAQSPFYTGTKMLVFRERYTRSYNSMVGTVVETQKRVVDNHHIWGVSGGTYVDGAIESPKELRSYTSVLGILNEDPDDFVFIVGQSYGISDDGRMVVRDAVRSDGKRLPSTGTSHPRTYLVERWYQAAPWAAECLPVPGDDAETALMLSQLAQQRFELRLGEVCILREANDRDWRDDLEDLDYTLPTPYYATAVAGTVFMPMSTRVAIADLPEDQRTMLNRIGERSFTDGTRGLTELVTRVEVPAQLVVRTSYEKYEQVEQVNEHTIRSAASDHFNVYDLTVGSVTKTPVITSVLAN